MNDMTIDIPASAVQAEPRFFPKVGLLIDGEWIFDRPDGEDIINPSDESVLGRTTHATDADLDRALAAADKGFAIWRKVSPVDRSALLHRAANIVRDRIEIFAATITLEQGKTLPDARAEVIRSVSFLDWDAENLLRRYGRIVPSEYLMQQISVREPVGPVAAFTPWNVPLSAPSRKISGSLAAGCSVIIKPASETPATTCLFAQAFMDAGLPDGVLNVVHGKSSAVSRKLLLSPVIRMVTLTGSVDVGKQLSRLAAEGVKPALMELGGHAPVIIDKDVDPANVARQAVIAKFRMAGQICASPTRFLIHSDVYEDFVSAFASGADALKVGDGFAEGVNMGPVVNARRVAEMDRLVADAVSRGARVAAGGRRIGNRGYFYAPTILADVPRDAEAMWTEPFGPLALCSRVADMDEALEIANDAHVGLAAYVFSNDIERVNHLWREVQCGVVATNSFNVSGAEIEFGGVKESGVGREGGEQGLDAYQVTKTVIQQLVRT
jgi:succinate-semialdehyde dehydrogenase/glutarate-semialdehyde dehydrogenase